MNNVIRHGFFYAALSLSMVACTEKDGIVPTGSNSVSSTVQDINVSSEFNFSTQREISVELTTLDASGEAAKGVYIEIYHRKSNVPVFSGITNAQGVLVANFSLLTQIEELVVVPRYQGFYNPVVISAFESKKSIQSNTLRLNIGKKSTANCEIAPGEYRTQTQGGWGTAAKGNNPGAYRDANFDTAFPDGLTIGSAFTLHLSTSSAVQAFLPQGGTASALNSNFVDPTGKVSVLAGQLVTATLSVGFDDADSNFGASTVALGDLEVATGTFEGMTVRELLTEANIFVGGGSSEYTASEFNSALTAINEGFDNGTTAGSFLVCPSDKPVADQDKDGVPDSVDEYPTDPSKAFNNPVDGTLVWEDLWPSTGDFDFNDLVTDYTYNLITNATNKVVELEATFEVRAIGAGFHNGLALEFDLAPEAIASVTGQHLRNLYVQTGGNGTELGQAKAVVFIFEDAFDILPHPGNGHLFVNTYPSEPHFDSQKTNTVRVAFKEPVLVSELGNLPFNPFLVQNKVRGVEIHLPDWANTGLANLELFQTSKDDTQPSIGRYYRTATNLPWALHLPVNFDYPIEKTDIGLAYPKFKEWAESNGTLYNDWYEDLAGYRVNEYIYH